MHECAGIQVFQVGECILLTWSTGKVHFTTIIIWQSGHLPCLKTSVITYKYIYLIKKEKKQNYQRNTMLDIEKVHLAGYHEICTFILSNAPESKWSDKNGQCSPAVHKANANLFDCVSYWFLHLE